MPKVFTNNRMMNQYFCLNPAALHKASPFQTSVQAMTKAIMNGLTPAQLARKLIDSMLMLKLYYNWPDESRTKYICFILTYLRVRKMVDYIPGIQMTYGNVLRSIMIKCLLTQSIEVHMNLFTMKRV